MNKIRAFALAAVASLASLSAFSSTIPLGTLSVPSQTSLPAQTYAVNTPSFTDDFTFSITAEAANSAAAIALNFPIVGAGVITLTGISLIGPSSTVTGSINAALGQANLQLNTIVAGSYTLRITGSATGGNPAASYFGSLNLTAVPEPGTLALFGFGLAAAGFAGRRGRKARI